MGVNEITFTRVPWNVWHFECKKYLTKFCELHHGLHHLQSCYRLKCDTPPSFCWRKPLFGNRFHWALVGVKMQQCQDFWSSIFIQLVSLFLSQLLRGKENVAFLMEFIYTNAVFITINTERKNTMSWSIGVMHPVEKGINSQNLFIFTKLLKPSQLPCIPKVQHSCKNVTGLVDSVLILKNNFIYNYNHFK
jgi:hypothetical protein